MKRSVPPRKRDLTGLLCTAGMGLLVLLAWATLPGLPAPEQVARQDVGPLERGPLMAPAPATRLTADPHAPASDPAPSIADAPGA